MTVFKPFPLVLHTVFAVALFSNYSTFGAVKYPSYLVRAKVIKILDKIELGRVPAILEVVHVYSGQTELVGKTFTDYQYGGPRSAGSETTKPFSIDEEGLWLLTEIKGELVFGSFPYASFRIRSRKEDGNPRHAQQLLLAEVIEKYTSAKPEERSKLAEKLANDTTPEVCYWMVRTLGDSDEKFASELLYKLRKDPVALTLKAQIALDEVNCIKQKEDWCTSAKRTELLKNWASRNANENEAQLVLSRLDASYQAFEMRGEAVIEILQVAAGNQDWRKEDRIKAIGSIGYQANRMPEYLAAYDWLFDLLKNSPEIEFRRRAAYEVGTLSLYPKRIQAVEDYLASEKDPEIIKTLRDALKKAKESEKK